MKAYYVSWFALFLVYVPVLVQWELHCRQTVVWAAVVFRRESRQQYITSTDIPVSVSPSRRYEWRDARYTSRCNTSNRSSDDWQLSMGCSARVPAQLLWRNSSDFHQHCRSLDTVYSLDSGLGQCLTTRAMCKVHEKHLYCHWSWLRVASSEAPDCTQDTETLTRTALIWVVIGFMVM